MNTVVKLSQQTPSISAPKFNLVQKLRLDSVVW